MSTSSSSKYVSKAQRTRNAQRAKKIAIASEAGQAPDNQMPYEKAKAAEKLGTETLEEFVKKFKDASVAKDTKKQANIILSVLVLNKLSDHEIISAFGIGFRRLKGIRPSADDPPLPLVCP